MLSQNPEMRKKVEALQDDPEMKEFFDELKARRFALAPLRTPCSWRAVSHSCVS